MTTTTRTQDSLTPGEVATATEVARNMLLRHDGTCPGCQPAAKAKPASESAGVAA